MKKQSLHLGLQGKQLFCQRLNHDGDLIGTEYRWKIGKHSIVPKELFFLIHGFVRRAENQNSTKSFRAIRRAIKRALEEAATACGCEVKRAAEGGHVTWYLQSEPFMAFQVHEGDVNDERARKMKKGNT